MIKQVNQEVFDKITAASDAAKAARADKMPDEIYFDLCLASNQILG
jgi:hypothetical protein